MAIAFGVAAVSDVLSIWLTFAPPFQWTLDLVTAVILFLILGTPVGALARTNCRSHSGHGNFSRLGSRRCFRSSSTTALKKPLKA